MPKQPSRSPRAALLTIFAALALTAGLTATPAGAEPQDQTARAEERAARLQEREAARAERQSIREARRSERERRRTTRAAERAAGKKPASHAHDTTGEPPSPNPASPSGAAPASTRGCRVTIQTSAARITAGEAVTVFGKVSCPSSGAEAASAGADGASNSVAGGEQLTIEQSTRNHEAGAVHAFAALGSVTTEADGSYQLAPVTPDSNTIFRVHLGRHGAHTGVRVAPVVTLNAPVPQAPAAQPSSVGGHVRLARRSQAVFSGTVTPAAPGARVALQVSYPADGEQWHTIAYGHVADGNFSIVHGLPLPGEAKLRVLAHPKGANAPGASEAITYTVPQPQNPQLTIQASANPLLFGQTVTLSGVAAGAAGQTVTLLARTKGGAFAPLATATTDEAGAYQFTAQAPPQNTYYEVSDTATRSVALFVGVKYALTLNPPPSAIAAGEALTISGSVAPARAGAVVYLERGGPSGLGFHPIASSTVGADGTFALAHAFASVSSAKLRVRLGSDGQNLGSASPPFVVTVNASPAATLTPESDAPAS